MFLGIEMTLLDAVIGVGVGVGFWVLFVAFMRERSGRIRHEERADMYRYQSSERAADARFLRGALETAEKARDFWYDTLSAEVNAESHRRAEAEGLVDELEGALELACADLADAEEEIEELEEESDGFEELAQEATDGWQASVNLVTHVIAWGESVLDALERRGGRL